MSLNEILDKALKQSSSLVSTQSSSLDLTEERIIAVLPQLRNLIAFYREYPDIFVDHMAESCGNPNHFEFYFYQRVFLRCVMRHRYVFATFPRAFSKSFLSMMTLMLRAILYPNSKLFVTTGGKEQAASITIAKIEEICNLIPALNNEIDWARGQSKKSKDNVRYIFKNGSTIDILAARESSRGQRRTGGLMEECVLIDGTALNEIIIPTTNVNRLLPNGLRSSKEEIVNKSQIYITTAGYKNNFAYEKNIELLIQSLIDPDEVMVLGGTYKIPVAEGLLDEDFVEQLKLQGTFSEESFDREYNSKWVGDAENSFFSSEKFDKHRTLVKSEESYNIKGRDSYYIIGVDVGRFDCTTEALIFKITPQPQGSSLASLVNIYTYSAEHFGQQALYLKRLFLKYKARTMAIDGNGIGAGLVDFLTISQVDEETGEVLPPFGVENDEDGKYRKLKTSDTIDDALYIIKANAAFNTEAYAYAQTQISSGKIRFLIDEAQAKTKLMSTRVGQQLSMQERNEYLRPYVLTSILREQMLNLVEDHEGVNIILKQSSRSIKKDKFSAFIYGLYYKKLQDDHNGKRRKRSISDFMFFTN
jgi:hypothetical protein